MQIAVIAHNIRSTHNIGSILRTCDGFGVERVFCTGYTPYPSQPKDARLPHIRHKITAQIHKTALGAEGTVPITQSDDPASVLDQLKLEGYRLIALEQAPSSINLADFTPSTKKIALLLGEEVHGIPQELLARCNTIVEIPMAGHKESFNVSVAAGIALYALTQN
jgi:tRNA G18 (ribose-2'-O)-methylase SpoU